MFPVDCNDCNDTKDDDILVWIVLLENNSKFFSKPSF